MEITFPTFTSLRFVEFQDYFSLVWHVAQVKFVHMFSSLWDVGEFYINHVRNSKPLLGFTSENELPA